MSELNRRLPRPFLLHSCLRMLLKVTRRRGAFTVARCKSRIFPNGEMIRLPTGNELFTPPDPHFIGFVLGRHEHHITELMREKVRSGHTCVDVGANIGYFSAIMAALAAPAGQVFCYEPDARNFHVLTINAEHARTTGSRVSVTRAAVSDERKLVTLVSGNESTLHHIIVDTEHVRGETVPAVSLDREFSGQGVINFLKVDVEGHEYEVLRGCRELIDARRIATAVVEIRAGENARRIHDLLLPWNPAIECWLNGAWRRVDLADLPVTTDAFIEFRC